MTGETLVAVLNSDRDWELTARDSTGAALTTLLDTDVLSASCWPGDDRALVFAPAVAWVLAQSATYKLSIAAAQTAPLAAATYRVQVRLARAGRQVVLFDGWLQLTAAPGSAVAAPTYGTYDDMLQYAGWLERLQSDSDQVGFGEERARARSWLDDLILASWRPNVGMMTPADPGFTAWSFAGSSRMGPSKWLRDQLDANRLMIRDRTREIVAKKAVGYACASQLGGLDKTPFQTLAAQYARDAESLVMCHVAEIDLNADGWPDLVIPCGSTSLR